MALDPSTGILYTNTNGSAYEIRLIPQKTRVDLAALWTLKHTKDAVVAIVLLTLAAILLRWPIPRGLAVCAALLLTASLLYGTKLHHDATRSAKRKFLNSPDAAGEVSPQRKTPFQIFRRVLQDEQGRPCTLPPWGKTVAINLNTGSFVWERPLGTMIEGQQTGMVGFGAPIVTASGLLFTGNSQQPLLRALDAHTGQPLWTGDLPAPAEATPMSYAVDGRQFVVVAAGGHGGIGTKLSDTLIAFSLDGQSSAK